MRIDRRDFLRATLAAGGAFWIGCSGSSDGDSDGSAIQPSPDGGAAPPDAAAAPVVCDDPFAGGSMAGTLELQDSGDPSFGQKTGSGMDARLYTDLGAIQPGQPTPPDMYYIRSEAPPRLAGTGGWTIPVGGLCDAPYQLGVDEIIANATDQGTFVMECSGNDTNDAFALMSAGRWAGVRIGTYFERAAPNSSATQVLVQGYDAFPNGGTSSTPGASWIFKRGWLENAKAFLATKLDGEPLTPDHGAPVRLYIPNWYGCACIKWVNSIQFVDDAAKATSQMIEFAHRTMQPGVPSRARDYVQATIDQSAMVTRVEKWTVGGKTRYRMVGILWGGDTPVKQLFVRQNPSDAWQQATICPPATTNKTWTLWTYAWDPPAAGWYQIGCKVGDEGVRTRRLDAGYYDRRVKVS